MADVLEFARRRQLFIDDYVIEESHGVTRVMSQPAKYAGNPLIRRTYPWMRSVSIYGTVMYEPEQESYRMWYQGSGTNSYHSCHATSRDGIFWDRPNLGFVEIEGSEDNNVVLPNACVPNVIKDSRENDLSRQYKSLFWDRTLRREPRTASVSVAFSADGLRWSKYDGNPVLTRSGDTHTLLGWDDLHGKYVHTSGPAGRRKATT